MGGFYRKCEASYAFGPPCGPQLLVSCLMAQHEELEGAFKRRIKEHLKSMSNYLYFYHLLGYYLILLSRLMEPPPWERAISFKTALAIAAVQKRKFDAELSTWQQKYAELEQKIQVLEAEKAKAIACGTPEVLLAAVFNTNSFLPDGLPTQAFDLPKQLDSLATSATLWTRAAEILSPDIYPFLCQVIDYATRRKATPTTVADVDNIACYGCGDFDGNTATTGATAAALIGTPTPAQSLILLMKDITLGTSTFEMATTTTTAATENYDEIILPEAVSCLSQLCLRPLDCLSEQDFAALQEFISLLLTACYTYTTNDDIDIDSSDTHLETSISGRYSIMPTKSSKAALTLLDTLQNSAGTGYIVLGCAGHGLQDLLVRLRAAVTGEGEVVPPDQKNQEKDLDQEERLIVRACLQVSSIVQNCLRELPTWSVEMSPDDGFLRSVAAAIWEGSAACDVVAPAHPEVAKQGQRCAALLVSALQKMSAAGPSTTNTIINMPPP